MMFHTNLKNIRLQCKRSQNDIAEYLHISPQSVSKWEKGESSPSIEYLPKLAEYLNCKIDDFFKELNILNADYSVIKDIFSIMESINKDIMTVIDLEVFLRKEKDSSNILAMFINALKSYKSITVFHIQNYFSCSLDEAHTILNHLTEGEYLINLDDNHTYVVVKQALDMLKMIIDTCYETIALKDKVSKDS